MRKLTVKRIGAVLLALSVLLVCSGCGKGAVDPGDGVPVSDSGRDLQRAAAADKLFSLNCNMEYSFNPLIATNHSNQLVCDLVYENMVEVDNSFEAIPNVLTGWLPNEDATYWTFDIASGHTFHDGTPVTGKDIRDSLDRAINSDRFIGRFASYQGSGYDAEHFYVTLGIGNTQFVKLLNIPIIQYGSMEEKYPQGSGPYTYNEDFTELHAYEGYEGYETLPLDTIYLKQYSDAESILTAFEDGVIDVVTNDPSSYTNLGYASTNEIHTFATTNLHFVAFNQESDMGRYNSFRQAMNYAFDRAYFARELMPGNAVAANVPMNPSCAAYPTEYAATLDYDLNTCKVVLENAGLKDYDEDGWLEFTAGSTQDVEIVFIVCSDSSAKTGVVRRFAQDMETIGLKVNVQELTWADYLAALEEGTFDMYYGEVKLRADFDITELLEEDSSLNYSRAADPNFEMYVNSYLGCAEVQRKGAYEDLCRYLAESGSLISIGFEKQQIIVHRGVVKGIDANIGNPLYNFKNWEIDLG